MSMRFRIFLLSLLLVTVGGFSIAAGGEFDPDVLNVGGYLEPTTMDPHVATSHGATMCHETYEPLWRLGPKQIPLLLQGGG